MASSTLHLSLDKVRRSIDDDDEPFIKEDTSPVSWADALDAYDDLLEGVLTPEKLVRRAPSPQREQRPRPDLSRAI